MPPAYKSVPAIEKCFATLGLFSATENPLGITDISRQLSLNKSTVFNMVYTLIDQKILDDLGNGKFGFGPRFYMMMGHTLSKRSRLVHIVHPYLQRINRETKLSAFLGIRSDLKAVLIDKADSAFGIKLSSEIGMQMPVLGGVGIKAMLSLLSRKQVDELIGNAVLKRYTPYTIVEKEAYLDEIDKIRREGIALDREEYIEGISAVGVPIKMKNRQIQAAIWIVGLNWQLAVESLQNVKNLLEGIAEEVNTQLG
ncbi:MAG: Acetate operon repressor [Syntrophus sp. PtaU1.Bin208]|nr:MAG: Acetate operon repressor [Syntrophus sp. PtaU1.Bin208]